MGNEKEILDSLGGVHDFGEGPVPARRHINPDGTLGGWVAKSVSFHEAREVWIGSNATVTDYVMLIGDVTIGDFASVRGRAHVGNAVVRGSATIKADSAIGTLNKDGARTLVRGSAVIAGNARIIDGSVIEGKAYIGGIGAEIKNAYVTDDARILGGTIHGATIREQATITGSPMIIGDDVMVEGRAHIGELVTLRGAIVVTGEVILKGSPVLIDSGTIDANDPLHGHLIKNAYIPSSYSPPSYLFTQNPQM